MCDTCEISIMSSVCDMCDMCVSKYQCDLNSNKRRQTPGVTMSFVKIVECLHVRFLFVSFFMTGALRFLLLMCVLTFFFSSIASLLCRVKWIILRFTVTCWLELSFRSISLSRTSPTCLFRKWLLRWWIVQFQRHMSDGWSHRHISSWSTYVSRTFISTATLIVILKVHISQFPKDGEQCVCLYVLCTSVRLCVCLYRCRCVSVCVVKVFCVCLTRAQW